MPFIKLDVGILDSTLWRDEIATRLLITAIGMAVPFEVRTPTPTYTVRGATETDFIVPEGWCGLVPAAGIGIVHRGRLTADDEKGLDALERLSAPETDSRTIDQQFEGRRMVRIDGGFLILQYDKFRNIDYTAAERMARYRAAHPKRRNGVT